MLCSKRVEERVEFLNGGQAFNIVQGRGHNFFVVFGQRAELKSGNGF
jgi:hypothetical protein